MLTALIIVLLLLTGVLLVLLFLPIRVVVDTARELYHVQWGPAHAGVFFGEDGIRYRMHLPFWTKEGDVGELLRTQGRKSQPAPSPRVRTTRRRPAIAPLLRSFQVERFRWVLDTDDPLWNAWLFPVFHLFQCRGHDVSISFSGRSELELTISNNLYRLLKAVLLQQPTNTQSHGQGHE